MEMAATTSHTMDTLANLIPLLLGPETTDESSFLVSLPRPKVLSQVFITIPESQTRLRATEITAEVEVDHVQHPLTSIVVPPVGIAQAQFN